MERKRSSCRFWWLWRGDKIMIEGDGLPLTAMHWLFSHLKFRRQNTNWSWLFLKDYFLHFLGLIIPLSFLICSKPLRTIKFEYLSVCKSCPQFIATCGALFWRKKKSKMWCVRWCPVLMPLISYTEFCVTVVNSFQTHWSFNLAQDIPWCCKMCDFTRDSNGTRQNLFPLLLSACMTFEVLRWMVWFADIRCLRGEPTLRKDVARFSKSFLSFAFLLRRSINA